MTEAYPIDADLNDLSGSSDLEQEVLFVPVGESPYYTSFYKMLYRLLDVARRAGDLRVYKDGDLTFGVRAGRFMDGPTPRDYAGAAEQALTNNQVNYIYLTAGGALTVNTSGFPAPDAAPHLPLATIETSAGSYEHGDITDCRGRAIYQAVTGLSPAHMNVLAGYLDDGFDRSAMAQETVTCAVPLARMTKTADGQALPSSPDGTNLGHVAGTHGTDTPKLASTAASGNTVTEKARFQFALPTEYVAGESVTLRLRVWTSAELEVSATIDAEAYKSDRQGGVSGGDLCATAAQSLGTSAADLDFTITPTALSAGDILDIELTVTLDDTGGSAGASATIGAVEILPAVKG